MKRAIVVGSGAGGAVVARELASAFDVTVLEAGGVFRRFSHNLAFFERLRSTRVLVDPRGMRLVFPAMRVAMAGDRMAIVYGVATGGTTTIATGNAVRCDEALLERGIDLGPEFDALQTELPISTAHQRRWRPVTRELFSACEALGLSPMATPKLVDYDRCNRCGRCVLGCPTGAKWDSRSFVGQAVAGGARLMTDACVERVVLENGGAAAGAATGAPTGGAPDRATGVLVRRGLHREFLPADLVVLAAGGLGTPAILGRSGIRTEDRLFVDPVLCVAGPAAGAHQDEEVPMPFIVEGDGYILSPYFDYPSFFFSPAWRRPRHDIVALMIKLADSELGSVKRRGAQKNLTDRDRQRLSAATESCTEILARFGVRRESVFMGMLTAGHPGGMLPLTGLEREPLHADRLASNLYVADASLFPVSLGKPPTLTIMALAKRVAGLCLERFA
ncbi:MAG: GMC family oxidoreductase [Thermoleophilia bacterium]|nr:GMC family oxidoreductase [Thermoleophilia bacterium]